MLPELPLAKGVEAANRIRAKVVAELTDAEGLQDVRISAGVCEAGEAQEDLDAVMAEAEGCLRRAQLDGGDRVATPVAPVEQAPP
jgi:GGDEF domain-containing protein